MASKWWNSKIRFSSAAELSRNVRSKHSVWRTTQELGAEHTQMPFALVSCKGMSWELGQIDYQDDLDQYWDPNDLSLFKLNVLVNFHV